MKRIVFLTQYFFPEMGAPQSRIYETALGLQRLGWDVHVVTAMPNYPTGHVFPQYKYKAYVREMVDGIPVYRFTLYASNARQRLPRIFSMLSFSITSLFSFFNLIKLKPDYIFTESPPLTLAATGIMLAKLTRARHVMNISDIWPLSALELGAISEGFLFNSLKKLEYALYKNSFACTGQSEEIVAYLSGNDCKRVHLFRNGVDIERFHAPVSSKGEGELRVVYAGLLGVAQGILQLVRNVDFRSSGVELHIYGSGAERNEIEQYLIADPNRGIYLHNTVNRNDIPALLSGFDLTLIPLMKPIYGAVPSKIYEAMAAGLPILFTGGGEGAKLVDEYKVGWNCTPGNYEGIKTAITNIAAMPAEQLQHVRDNCRKAAEDHFDRKRQVDSLHRFLNQA